MAYSYIRAEDLEPAFSAILQAKKGSFWVKEITSLFPWCLRHRLYWATTVERRNAVAVVSDSGRIEMLTSPEGLKALSGLLISERGSLPGNLSATEIAEAVRKLTVGPPGLVATRDLSERKSPPLFAWLTDMPKGDEASFRSLCITPVLEVAEKGEWKVIFDYFNDRGGVEHWIVSGRLDQLIAAEKTVHFPDGTFNWPFE